MSQKKQSKKNVSKLKSLIGEKGASFTVQKKPYLLEVKEASSCSESCPAGVNVKAYISLISNRKFEEAVEVIRENNPFPAICGRVCTRPCEESCELQDQGDSIPIRALKRYASDYEVARRDIVSQPCDLCHSQKIAIIGAGPAGLTAAVDLINKGYPVTVYEAEEKPGGMLQYGIPPYRLSDRVLKREIDWIKSLGIEIKTHQKITNPSALLTKGYDAVLMAFGAHRANPLTIKGGNAQGIKNPLLFLHEINCNKTPTIQAPVLVIGGGSTAIDVARSAIRLGIKQVTIAYRRDIDQMPADKEEVEAAKREGINIVTLAIPKQITTNNNKITGVEFLKAKLGEPDKSGRKKPIPIPNSEFVITASSLFPAIGATPDLQETTEKTSLDITKGLVTTSPYAATTCKGVFAAGDVQTGPSSVVESIGQGHKAAIGIDAYLRGIAPKINHKNNEHLQIVTDKKTTNKTIHHLKYTSNKNTLDFQDHEPTYQEFEAVEEAERCQRCGPCSACHICLPNCSNTQLIADIQNKTYLTKAPFELAQTLIENGPVTTTVTTDHTTLPITLTSLTAIVDPQRCIGCGRCEEVCAYHAINTVIPKNKPITAKINHQACASCSACVSICPTGAISQGFMSDDHLFTRIQQNTSSNNKTIRLTPIWNNTTLSFGQKPGIVELMSERKFTPLFLIRALAKTKQGLHLFIPEKSHYLAWQESTENHIKHTKQILELTGISPLRLKKEQNTPLPSSKASQKQVTKEKLSPLPTIHIEPKNPLYDTLLLLRILTTFSDIEPTDTYSTSSAPKNTTMLFEACIPLLDSIGKATKLFSLEKTRQALRSLSTTLKLNQGFIQNLSCASTKVLQATIENKDQMVAQITEKNKQILKEKQPKKILFSTPESYHTFKNDPAFSSIAESAVKKLYNTLSQSKTNLQPISKKIALHPACTMQKDPFYESIKKILNKIPQISIIELKQPCGNTGFEVITEKEKHAATQLLHKAEKQGAEMVLCSSPYCQTHLQLCNRKGSWQTTEIEITDIYQILQQIITR